MHRKRVSYISCFTFFLCLVLFLSVPAGAVNDRMVAFNFVDVELPTLTKFISDVTGKNFIFDERLKGKITIIAPSKLRVDDAFSLFTSVLGMKGYTVIPSGVDAYKILPAAEARQTGVKLTSDREPVNESYIARLIPLKNISSDDALKLIKPVVSKNGLASEFGPGNLLLVVDSGMNIEKILSIIESIDQTALREEPDIVFLKNSSADDVAKILNEGMGADRTRIVSRQPSLQKAAKAVADQRLNAVILFGDRSAKESMKSLITALDVPSAEAQGRINVYFLENADATELAKVLEGIIKSSRQQAHGRSSKGAAPVTPFTAAGDITITADSASNALIIVASPSDYKNLSYVIKQLDRRRKQVFVEAMIVEASIDKLRDLGTKWRVIGTHDGEPVGIGGFGTVDSSSIQSLIFGLAGVSGGGMGNFLDIPVSTIDPSTGEVVQSTLNVPGFAALFNLNEFKGAINVLSTPQILTSDNKEAEILVGENVPFITSRERDITTTNTVLSSVVRTDVGIILRITPQITEGDYVKLDIFQEISAVKEESNSDILINVGPTTTKRSTSTSVVVKDAQTVVIGGLMQERKEDNVTQLPVLGDIPLLGWLFKTKTVSNKKTNLLVFITPHIVKDAEDIARITEEKKREYATAEKQYAEGELLVRFNDDVTDERAQEIIHAHGAAVIKFIETIGVYLIKLHQDMSVKDAVEKFSSIPEVRYAEPNYKMTIQGNK